jgi:hypothetical protein
MGGATRAAGVPQSAGGDWTPQTFPGWSRASPISQSFESAPKEIQFATRAVTLPTPGSPSSWTGVPASTARENFIPQPCGFTTSVCAFSMNGCAGSRLVTRMGISQRMRVLRRAAAAAFSVVLIVLLEFYAGRHVNDRSGLDGGHQSNHQSGKKYWNSRVGESATEQTLSLCDAGNKHYPQVLTRGCWQRPT